VSNDDKKNSQTVCTKQLRTMPPEQSVLGDGDSFLKLVAAILEPLVVPQCVHQAQIEAQPPATGDDDNDHKGHPQQYRAAS
jgi:hypothetical protein